MAATKRQSKELLPKMDRTKERSSGAVGSLKAMASADSLLGKTNRLEEEEVVEETESSLRKEA